MEKYFLLKDKTAKRLYDAVCELPIIDYHCHLSAQDICENKRFAGITPLWLDGDHYKWRLMRIAGVEERFITGDADDYARFEKYICALAYAAGSPLYAWSRLELAKYFGVDDEISPENARLIYDKANAAIAEKNLTPQKIFEMSRVECVGTIEDVYCDPVYHKQIAEKLKSTRVLPVFRGDKVLRLDDANFAGHIQKLSAVSGVAIDGIHALRLAISKQLDAFVDCGCFGSDFSFEGLEYTACTDEEADILLKHALANNAAHSEKYLSYMLHFMISESYKRNLSVQIHIGAMRNNNTGLFESLGADVGCDAISARPYLSGLSALLNSFEETGRTIIFNLNPAVNAQIGALAGCFCGGGMRGRVTQGAAWWFNDHRDGMEEQLRAYAAHSNLGTFAGMLTDSRSMVSYPRHDYFRRILCNYLGKLADDGEFTADGKILTKLAVDLCYANAAEYFRSGRIKE